jgi:hypothetical protein
VVFGHRFLAAQASLCITFSPANAPYSEAMGIWKIDKPQTGLSVWAFEKPSCIDLVQEVGMMVHTQSVPIVGSVLDTLRARYGTEARIGECELGQGEHYPRMWRRGYSPAPALAYRREWSLSVQAARNLLADMRDVFRCIEPAIGSNASAYGHRVRDLLMLACMEVESACKSVLLANNYTSSRRRRDTRDYVELLGPMRLDEWEIALTMHLGFPPFRPFAGWDRARPTDSLPWYDRYNAVKHGREAEFHKATVEAMIHAMGAAVVLVSAQFGPWGRFLPNGDMDERYGEAATPWVDDFTFLALPKWAPEKLYVPPVFRGTGPWTPRPFWL